MQVGPRSEYNGEANPNCSSSSIPAEQVCYHLSKKEKQVRIEAWQLARGLNTTAVPCKEDANCVRYTREKCTAVYIYAGDLHLI